MLRRVLCLLPCLLILAPAAANAAVSQKKAIWGPVEVESVSQFPVYKELGAGIYMTKLEWDKVAIFKPEAAKDPLDTGYDWPAELDTAVDEAKRNGIDVALTVTGTPEWANGGKAANYAPTNPKDYADFLSAAAARYPGVHLWLIWDGPSRSATYRPVSAGGYARLLDAAYAALKAKSSLNRVVGGNSAATGTLTPKRWISGLKLANGKAPRMDFFGHDPSSKRRPDAKTLDALNASVREAFGRKRLFLTNFTLPTNTNWRYDFKVSPSAQASWLTAAFKLAKSKSYVYTLAYNGLFDEVARPDNRQVESGLIDAEGAKRPAYAAFSRG